MNPSRHARAKELFLAACELDDEPGGERGRFLAAACAGDEALRREVESLLDVHFEAVDGATRRDHPVLDPAATVAAAAVDSAGPTPERGAGEPVRFAPGHVFAGRYRIVAELGRGGMGQVFRADDLVLDAPVALKFLPPGVRRSKSLINEVRLARRVTHPNVCRVFDFGEAEGEVFLTMEYVDGEDLGALLTRIGRLPDDKLVELARELCEALDAAHAEGVLHRDLKPANVLIDGRGRARITDFGIAVLEASAAVSRVGTPAYMAPEQWDGEAATVRSDLYALGLVLYEMATGQPAFRGATPEEFAEQHRAAAPPLPSSRLAGLDPVLEAVILRCLAKDPGERPASAREVAAALPGGDPLDRALAAGETPSPELVARAGEAGRLGAGRAAAVAAALLASLAAVLALGDRVHAGRRPWGPASPEVLAARAGEILGELGHILPAGDRAWGFRPDLAAAGDVYLFWYRQSLEPMVPYDLGAAVDQVRVGYYDPPPLEAGDVQLLLDAGGRLIALRVRLAAPDGTPLDPADGGLDPAAPPSVGVDWQALLRAAGLDGQPLEPSSPRLWPPSYAAERLAWTAADPRHPDGQVRVEAAAVGGRVVFFDQREAGLELAAEGFGSRLEDAYFLGLGLLSAALTVGVVLVARTNLRRGRGDLPGALRLAVGVAAVNGLRWLLATDHVPELDAEAQLFLAGIARVLSEALMVWLAYIALEPLVRRHWPRTLIAWSRLQHGRRRDPWVGRSVLVGTLAGVGWVLLSGLDRLAAEAMGLAPTMDFYVEAQLETALSTRRVLAHLLTAGVEALYWGLLQLFLLVVLAAVLRRRAAAIVAFLLLTVPVETLGGYHPAISWLTLGLGIGGVTAVLLVRFGLLSLVAALFAYHVLLGLPLTLDAPAWFAESGYWTLAAFAAFGAWAAGLAAGRPSK